MIIHNDHTHNESGEDLMNDSEQNLWCELLKLYKTKGCKILFLKLEVNGDNTNNSLAITDFSSIMFIIIICSKVVLLNLIVTTCLEYAYQCDNYSYSLNG